MTALSQIDAVILAGGLGTRLRTVLPGQQKVVGEIAGQPFLHRVLNQFATAGIERFVFALGHRAVQVEAAIEAWRPAHITTALSTEPAPLGTGGAVRYALGQIASETVLIANGDSYAGLDLAALLAFHCARQARITLLLVPVPATESGRYGRVRAAADGTVLAFEEKPENGAATGAINAGVYVMDRAAIAAMPDDRPLSLEREIFPAYVGRGLYGHLQGVPFIDIGTPESWAAADAFFAAMAGNTGTA